jgi:hypothetical protein
MSWPCEPVTVVEEFVAQTLLADPAVAAAMGSGNIWPAQSPPDITDRHLVHDFAGPDGGEPAVPLGQAIALLSLRWDITAWIPGMDRQPLRDAMRAVQAALTGPNRTGQWFRFTSVDGSVWDLACSYRGPILVRPEIGPQGLWQRLSGRYRIQLQQVAGPTG